MDGRVGVEIGGSFTDLVWRRGDGALVTHKVLSTPEASARPPRSSLPSSAPRPGPTR